MKYVTVSKARDQFSDVVNAVLYCKEPIVIRRRGKNIAAIVPLDFIGVGPYETKQDSFDESAVKIDHELNSTKEESLAID
jgi:prevent-host-death family protein